MRIFTPQLDNFQELKLLVHGAALPDQLIDSPHVKMLSAVGVGDLPRDVRSHTSLCN